MLNPIDLYVLYCNPCSYFLKKDGSINLLKIIENQNAVVRYQKASSANKKLDNLIGIVFHVQFQ